MRYPVARPVTSTHGGYGVRRTTRALCAGQTPPCVHHGLDLAGKAGTPVYAPETGTLAYVFNGDKVKPFSRFGPAGVVIRGLSGNYHLLMHLEPPTVFTAQQTTRKGVQHATRLSGAIAVMEGEQVGVMSGKRHVHWEVRRDPTDRGSHVDPVLLLVEHPSLPSPPAPTPAPASTPPPALPSSSPATSTARDEGGGGSGLLAILLLVALSTRSKRR